jgi:hypothetical protein
MPLAVSFLTPLAALAVLAVALPLAALAATERRADTVRRVLGVPAPGGRAWVVPALCLVLLVGLVATAAAQPVVVRQHRIDERGDAQAFFIFDVSTSMQASRGFGRPTRLSRAKRLALRLAAALPDLPIGIASMTDRALPNLMPTPDVALFRRTLEQSVQLDEPPPSQVYHDRATTFDALVPLEQAHLFPPGVRRRLLVVFTDGEAVPLSPVLRLTPPHHLDLILVHVWADDDRIYTAGGRVDRRYSADPASARLLDELRSLVGGRVFDEHSRSAIARAAREDVGSGGTTIHVDAYARRPLAPWFVLGGVAPLGFLVWRRNV